MKTKKFYPPLLAILFFFTTTNINAQQQAQLPAGVSQDWYAKTVASLTELQYSFHAQPSSESFIVHNPKNHLDFTMNQLGYTVKNQPTMAGAYTWQTSFTLKGIGRPGDKKLPSSINTIQDGATLTYTSAFADIQYVNSEQGLRQNFIIKNKPAGEGPLVTSLSIQSPLDIHITNKNALIFSTPGNKKDGQLVYDGLQVWDATHRALPASFELDENSREISIVVQDENAVYPVTIDPLNHLPDWQSSANGILPGLLNTLALQVNATYGFTVAGLGDINGDGFDDVAVSAPTMADIVSGTGTLSSVGAVFIFLGSTTGLKSQADKVLQPTTAVNGALFGFSIDAGDITGDGKNDIVISAPLDSYTTTAAGFPFSATVKAGKVYFYRSEDLLASSNPSPFVQIRLQGSNFFSNGVAGLLLSNVTVNALFGYSVAVTKDLNGDAKADVIIGSPAYLGTSLLAVQNGAAFVYYSNNLSTTTPTQLNPPSMALLGVTGLSLLNTTGLLFGFSVDGAGDFDKNGNPDVVVGAPAGVDLSSLGGIFTGQALGGSAYVFYGNGSGVATTATVKLQADPSGLLANAANLFGYTVKGMQDRFGNKNGMILIGSPGGDLINNALGLVVKAGKVHVFKQVAINAAGTFGPVQSIPSPRATSVLSILAGQTINLSVLFGASLDNMMDVNCDNNADIIVGEPLSTAVTVPLVGADVLGGSAYIFLGKADSTFVATPYWDLHVETSPLLGINTTSLIGMSVACAGKITGTNGSVRSLIGGQTNSLDFGVGLLNLNNTIGTTWNFVADSNNLGKAYMYGFTNCNVILPIRLLEFTGHISNKTVPLNWSAITDGNFNHFELERSIDANTYEPIALVMGANNTGSRTDYQYVDKHPYTGTNYYRLKLVDNDNHVTYSNIVVIRFDDHIPSDIVVAPNPAQGDINLRMTGLDKGMYQMELVSTSGQVLLKRPVAVSQYTQTETIRRQSSIAPGMYWVNIYDDTNRKIKTLRVLVQ